MAVRAPGRWRSAAQRLKSAASLCLAWPYTIRRLCGEPENICGRKAVSKTLPNLASLSLAAVIAAGACGAPVREPAPASVPAAAPASAAASPASASAEAAGARRYTEADVRFMTGMIAHHAQALEMTGLVFARTGREDVRMLSRRIELSQQEEIRGMRRWLIDRGLPAPDPQGSASHDAMGGMPMQHDSTHHEMMPGMLTPEQLTELGRASGPAFDRLFLEDMIRHHQGALQMVAALLATRGAAQEPETFRFASDVDADQRAEIARMQAMFAAAPPAPAPR